MATAQRVKSLLTTALVSGSVQSTVFLSYQPIAIANTQIEPVDIAVSLVAHLPQDLLPQTRSPVQIEPVPVTLTNPRPISGSQLYHQRWAALRMGRIYTRLSPDSLHSAWVNATEQPTHQQWLELTAQEARVMAKSQGTNPLTVLLGDSLLLWFPPELLPNQGFYLNQGISGDTTAGVLNRLSVLGQTRPQVIHLMVGINDLRRGKSDQEILSNLQQIMQRLRQQHPQTQIFVHSILPTRLASIPSDRIQHLNQRLVTLTQQEGVSYLNLEANFVDAQGYLRRELTTDGVHLNLQGYMTWQSAIQ